MTFKLTLLLGSLLTLGACTTTSTLANNADTSSQTVTSTYNTVGQIARYSDDSLAVIPADTVIEKLTEDKFQWSEGPLWIAEQNTVLFTDVPQNTLYSWSDQAGLSVFLKPSGLEGNDVEGIFNSAGANGLVRAPDGGIYAGDHGNRAITHINLTTKVKTPVVSAFEGKKLNSPNDLVLTANGNIFFTDPPYGLNGQDESAAKEQSHNGLYYADLSGDIPVITLLDNSLTRPNGVVLSPDGRKLYVAVSDPDAAKYYTYDVAPDGSVSGKSTLYDATHLVKAGKPGLPDGMAISKDGYLFATGPGGVLVFSPNGEFIATIETGTAIANCTFGGVDGRTLYMTSASFLARADVSVTGLDF